MLHRERRTSSRSSSSSGFSRRESLFDLLFLLRRSSHRHKAQVENESISTSITLKAAKDVKTWVSFTPLQFYNLKISLANFSKSYSAFMEFFLIESN
ncbi:hypothetical protein T4D_533 [Trichinella pseudospiralis]|uniref:Uncharacterized protein n=1 Tax=Trichinella pseudospiralis TaxID=6337 RepID=A0A0V1F6X1_TRIPS|nr:hypothetical protein T4D_533 [Trichinella pseudospiralis]